VNAAAATPGPEVHRERELKFAVDRDFVLPAFDALPHHPIVVPVPDVTLDATYYDTRDVHLARWGVTIRFRSDDGWTLKLPHGKRRGAPLARDEVYLPGDESIVPPAALAIVRALVRDHPVIPVARLVTHRHRQLLVTLDGTRLAHITRDQVAAIPADGDEHHFHELEIELTDAADDALVETISELMRVAGAGEPSRTPKLVRALGARASAPPDVSASDHLPPDATGCDLIGAAFAASAARLMRYDPRVRVGGDSENVHQARVATRRLRSDLRTFRPFLEREWAESLRSELADVGAALGAVRDAEVLAERLYALTDTLDDDLAADATPILSTIDRQHRTARDALLGAMNTSDYFALLDALIDAAHHPRVRRRADEPASLLATKAMKKPWHALESAVGRLGPEPPDTDLHHVRILAKRVRYAAEAFNPVVGRDARTFAKRVAAVQTVLGDHQDAVVCATWLRTLAPTLPMRARHIANQLAAAETEAARRHREDWLPVWDIANDPALRRWW